MTVYDMPTFSPLARGFSTWDGELHLNENEKVHYILYKYPNVIYFNDVGPGFICVHNA